MSYEVTLHELSETYGIDKKSLLSKLTYNGFVPKKKNNKNIYDSSVLDFLNNFYSINCPVEIVRVPVYVNVYWEILPSRMNYDPNI